MFVKAQEKNPQWASFANTCAEMFLRCTQNNRAFKITIRFLTRALACSVFYHRVNVRESGLF